jgi:hypothetical protein
MHGQPDRAFLSLGCGFFISDRKSNEEAIHGLIFSDV